MGRWCTAALALAAAWTPAAAEESSLNLYRWMGTAPTVVVLEAMEGRGKLVRARALRTPRGDLGRGETLDVELRRANRDRPRSRAALALEPGRRYVALLEETARPEGRPRRFRLVRGIDGVKEVPPEGADTYLEAIDRLVEVQDGGDHHEQWRAFRGMLEATNPILLDTALDQYLRFDHGDPDLVPALVPLLDHPRPDVRRRSAELMGEILLHRPRDRGEDVRPARTAMIARARRDPAVEVRVAATRALAAFGDPAIDEVLDEISRDDPEQAVRYAAERALYDRRSVPR